VANKKKRRRFIALSYADTGRMENMDAVADSSISASVAISDLLR
jgi:hypothetical protein|tara:strand:+ start:244 stop:375 length:132 start_codon:yes stop_codon:yes gene_type:complete